jgi:hypothetical protein
VCAVQSIKVSISLSRHLYGIILFVVMSEILTNLGFHYRPLCWIEPMLSGSTSIWIRRGSIKSLICTYCKIHFLFLFCPVQNKDSRGILIVQIVSPCAWCFILCLYTFVFSSIRLLISYNLFDRYLCLQILANLIPTNYCETKSM